MTASGECGFKCLVVDGALPWGLSALAAVVCRQASGYEDAAGRPTSASCAGRDPGVEKPNDQSGRRRLSEETGLKADFVEGTVYQAPDLAPGPFDLVFTTWGTIYWLPDVKSWAKAIASVLAPGGELYFADTHPGFAVLEEYAERFVPTYDFQTPPDQPLQFTSETTYTGDPTILSHQSTREWIHSLSAVLGGLIDAGLTITMFREHEVLPWQGLAGLVPAFARRIHAGQSASRCRTSRSRARLMSLASVGNMTFLG